MMIYFPGVGFEASLLAASVDGARREGGAAGLCQAPRRLPLNFGDDCGRLSPAVYLARGELSRQPFATRAARAFRMRAFVLVVRAAALRFRHAPVTSDDFDADADWRSRMHVILMPPQPPAMVGAPPMSALLSITA